MLILSQVILSLQLPFAVIPLIHFTSNPARMGSFRSPTWVRVLAWTAATIIVGLNLRLAWMTIGEWLAESGAWAPLIWGLAIPGGLVLLLLLGWVTLEPVISRWISKFGRAPVDLPESALVEAPDFGYRKILVPLDHSGLDRLAVAHAAALARQHGACVHLLHVEEGVTSQVYGTAASTAEVEAGHEYLARIAESLKKQGIQVETRITHSASPRKAIVSYAHETAPDLVIMGAHGHGGLKDLIFGTTIDPVRHDLDIPILIVRPTRT
jgi:manganese transport protein